MVWRVGARQSLQGRHRAGLFFRLANCPTQKNSSKYRLPVVRLRGCVMTCRESAAHAPLNSWIMSPPLSSTSSFQQLRRGIKLRNWYARRRLRRQKYLVELMLVLTSSDSALQRFAGEIPRRTNPDGFQDGPVAVVVILVPAALMPVQRSR